MFALMVFVEDMFWYGFRVWIELPGHQRYLGTHLKRDTIIQGVLNRLAPGEGGVVLE